MPMTAIKEAESDSDEEEKKEPQQDKALVFSTLGVESPRSSDAPIVGDMIPRKNSFEPFESQSRSLS